MADAARAAATLRAAAEAVPAAALAADDAAARQALFRRLASAAESSAAAAPVPASLLAPRQLVQLKAQLKVMASLSRRVDVSPELLALAHLPDASADAAGAAPPTSHAAHADAAREVRAARALHGFAASSALAQLCFAVCAVSCACFPLASRRDFRRRVAATAAAPRRRSTPPQSRVRGPLAVRCGPLYTAETGGFALPSRLFVAPPHALYPGRPAAATAAALPGPAALALRLPPSTLAPPPPTPSFTPAELRAEAQRRLAQRIAARVAELDNLPQARAAVSMRRRGASS